MKSSSRSDLAQTRTMLEFYILQIFFLGLLVCTGAENSPVQSIIVAEVPGVVNAARPTTYQRCLTPNKGLGQCVHLVRCPLPEFTTDRLRFMDFFCIIDRVYIGVCCPDSFVYQMNAGYFNGNPAGILPAIGNDLTEVHIIEIDPNALSQGSNPPEGQHNESENDPQANTEEGDSTKKIVFQERRGCGVNQNENYFRVVGGRPADPKQWPWMVSILNNREHFCGGVLITERHILTAAHCFRGRNTKTVIVRLGEHDLRRIEETRTQDFRIADVRLHKDFDPATYENDIAILRIDRPARFNSYAWPVCLPQPNDNFSNKDAVVIGWGATEYGGSASDILMEVSVPVWNNTECDDEYLQVIFDTNLCAGGHPGRDSCQGDSGGPLLYQLPNKRWITIGVVSWGIGCGEERPAVYTRVSKYLDWILKNSAF